MLEKKITTSILNWMIASNEDTPVFFYNGNVVCLGVEKLKRELGAKISFSTKANSHPFVLHELKDSIDEFNVTNLFDLDSLLNLGVHPGRISWIHPVTPVFTLKKVISKGIQKFVIDDERGLDELNQLGTGFSITLRIRPEIHAVSKRSLVRFGNEPGVLFELAKKAISFGHHIEALSFFVGVSDNESDLTSSYSAGIQAAAYLYRKLDNQGIEVKTINIGGGFPGSQRRFYYDNPDFLSSINRIFHKNFSSDITMLCEPGRFLVEPCMLMASRVIADRKFANQRLVHIEASAYGGLFETSFIDPEDTLTIGVLADTESTSACLLGPIMDSFDIIKRQFNLPLLQTNDWILLANVGAYAIGYSNRAEGIVSPNVIKLPKELSLMLDEVWYD